ncbi:MAG: DUF370 domain-containing protein [Candidatus Riflebacteria bacterium]|nr:DUF370 domain-containing protein [Candidatus Riflebacteria bacterium]
MNRTRVRKKARLLNVGFGNFVLVNRIIAIVGPGSAPIKRMKEEARDRGKLIDATNGRKTRAIIVADSEHVILSAINPTTAAMRLLGKKVDFSEEIDVENNENGSKSLPEVEKE